VGELRIWFGLWLAAMLVLLAIPAQPRPTGPPLAGTCLEGKPVLTSWAPALEAEFHPGCQGDQLRLLVKTAEGMRPLEQPEDFAQWAFLRLNNQVVVNPYKDAYPFVTQSAGEPLIPLRLVTEALGGQVEWDESSQKATARWRGRALVLTVGEASAALNGEPLALAQAPVLWLDRVMVSPDLLAQAFGVRATWNEEWRQVEIRAAGVLCPATFCVKV